MHKYICIYTYIHIYIHLPSLCAQTLQVPHLNLKFAAGKFWIVIAESLAYKILLHAILPGSLKCRGGGDLPYPWFAYEQG